MWVVDEALHFPFSYHTTSRCVRIDGLEQSNWYMDIGAAVGHAYPIL